MIKITSPDNIDVDVHTTPSALIVAHPGHQVRVHGWLETARPRVLILTDGSGNSGQSRLNVTTEYLSEIGVEPGAIYGQCSDRIIYRKILNHDFGFFTGLVDKLAVTLSDEGVKFVVGDAAEGYNSTHDVCRLIIDAAVEMLNRSNGGKVYNFDFPVVKQPDDCPEQFRHEAVWLHLDEGSFARKLEAARSYYPELLEEVRTAFSSAGSGPLRDYLSLTYKDDAGADENGLEAFRVECLRPVVASSMNDGDTGAKPFYEHHGERQVKAGHYTHVIRYREHIAPLAERLWRHIS